MHNTMYLGSGISKGPLFYCHVYILLYKCLCMCPPPPLPHPPPYGSGLWGYHHSRFGSTETNRNLWDTIVPSCYPLCQYTTRMYHWVHFCHTFNYKDSQRFFDIPTGYMRAMWSITAAQGCGLYSPHTKCGISLHIPCSLLYVIAFVSGYPQPNIGSGSITVSSESNVAA